MPNIVRIVINYLIIKHNVAGYANLVCVCNAVWRKFDEYCFDTNLNIFSFNLLFRTSCVRVHLLLIYFLWFLWRMNNLFIY